ncbi:MAG: FtsX-like permease family protein [Longibaculum sp.]
MFKEDYMKELAFHNIKKQSKLYRDMFVALVMTFFLSSFMFIIFSSYEQISYEEKAYHYGKWCLAVDHHVRDKVTVDYPCEQGKVYFIDDIYKDGRLLGKLGSLDQNAKELTQIHLLDGRFPETNEEIAIEESLCEYLGVEKQLNQTITLQIGNMKKNILLVGILKDYSSTFPIEIPSFLTNQTHFDYTLLMSSDDNLDLLNHFQSQEQYLTYNFYTYTQYQLVNDYYQEISMIKYREICILSIGLIGVLLTMLSMLNKRKEFFVLMRRLGATVMQIQRTIMYECVFLMIPSFILGILLSIIISLFCLLIYHYILGSPFVFSINMQWFYYMCISIIMSFISMFFVSLSVYNISIVKNMKQIVHKSKKVCSHQLNVFSLAVKEMIQNQRIFILLSMMSSLFIIFSLFFMSLNISYFNIKDDLAFTHEINGENLNNDDYHQISQINHLESFFLQLQYIDIKNDSSDTITNGCIVCVEDKQQVYQNIILQQKLEGRFPIYDNETVLMVPDVQSIDMKIGDQIQMSEDVKKLNVVGIIRYHDNDKKINEIMSFGQNQLLVTASCFTQIEGFSTMKKIYVNTNNFESIHQLKAVVYDLMKNNSHLYFNDYLSFHEVVQFQKQKDFTKDISFTVLFLIGTASLLYIQRKLRIQSLKHNIGLMKAVGLTQKQLILMYVIYDFMVFLLGFIWVILLLLIMNLNQIYYFYQSICSLSFVVCIIVSGFCVSLIMILPVMWLKNVSIMNLLNEKE